MSSSINNDNNNNMHFLSAIETTLGKPLLERIRSSRLLVVGAGGIGCELLKNLALTGFTNLQVVDLDTIDVSNLNRQLLFRSQHVGMPKCITACQVASNLTVPAGDTPVSYKAHHANICDKNMFNIDFMKQFDVILNALDNVTARRVVNRLALAAGVPLVEAGTTGYLGQVNVIQSGSACYECQTQETQKVYPICTIRSTPSMPVHTIVWAKEFYKLLFHSNVQESMLYEDENGEEPSTYMRAVRNLRTFLEQRRDTSSVTPDESILRDAALHILRAMYVTEIQKQLDMDRYKTARKKPVVLSEDALIAGSSQIEAPTRSQAATYQMQSAPIWKEAECVAEFIACIQDAATDNTVSEVFDKDDTLSMRFVTATSNLRSSLFDIQPLQSFYSAKGIAGNIIPAIATTNAICAGLQILQVFHILAGRKCSYINCIRNRTRNGLYLTATTLNPPNPACFVCQKSTVPLTLQDPANWTLQQFVDDILKKQLGFAEPSISIDGNVIWEEGEDADDSYLVNTTKFLPALPCGGIQSGSIITVEDFSQDLTVDIAVSKGDVEGNEDEDKTFKFNIGHLPPGTVKGTSNGNGEPAAAATPFDGLAAGHDNGGNDDDDDDIIVVVRHKNGDKKRAGKDNETNGSHLRKKRKIAAPDDVIIEID